MVLIAAILLQTGSLILLRAMLGKSIWLSRPFTIMLIFAFVYHGVSELLLLIPDVGSINMYRTSQSNLDYHLGSLIIGSAMFVATSGYLLALGKIQKRNVSTQDLALAIRVLDWRLLVIALVPLAVYTYSGQGFSSGKILDSSSMSFLEILASSFFTALLTLLSFVVIAKFGVGAVLPALVIQSILIAAAGQRLQVLIAAIVVLMMSKLIGVQVSRKTTIALTLVAVILLFGITSVRENSGRDIFYSDSGIWQRINAIVSSTMSMNSNSDGSNRPLLAQFAERIDSNEWAAGIAAGMSERQPPGLAGVLESTGQLVPAILNPDKRNMSLLAISPEQFQINYYRTMQADHLPGHFGMWLGISGIYWYFPLMFAFGFSFGLLEKWIFHRITAARLIWLVLLSIGAFTYEGGLVVLGIWLRYGLILGPAAWLLQRIITPEKNNQTISFNNVEVR